MSYAIERSYLLEARQILDAQEGEAMYLAERAHLVALQAYYDEELIKMARGLETLQRQAMEM